MSLFPELLRDHPYNADMMADADLANADAPANSYTASLVVLEGATEIPPSVSAIDEAPGQTIYWPITKLLKDQVNLGYDFLGRPQTCVTANSLCMMHVLVPDIYRTWAKCYFCVSGFFRSADKTGVVVLNNGYVARDGEAIPEEEYIANEEQLLRSLLTASSASGCTRKVDRATWLAAMNCAVDLFEKCFFLVGKGILCERDSSDEYNNCLAIARLSAQLMLGSVNYCDALCLDPATRQIAKKYVPTGTSLQKTRPVVERTYPAHSPSVPIFDAIEFVRQELISDNRKGDNSLCCYHYQMLVIDRYPDQFWQHNGNLVWVGATSHMAHIMESAEQEAMELFSREQNHW